MHPDDVEAALDALASEQPAPSATAASVTKRARHRLTQRRVAFIGIAAALLAVVATVASVSAFRTTVTKVSTVPLINVPPEARGPQQSSRFPSALEGWKCGNPMQYTADGGETWHEVALPAGLNVDFGTCTAETGGNAWETSWNGHGTQWRLVRIRGLHDVKIFSLPPVPKEDLNPTLTFVDKNHGWFRTLVFKGEAHLYRTEDGGATWKLATDRLPAGRFVVREHHGRGWSLDDNTLLGTTDGGTTWRRIGSLPAPARRGEVVHFELTAFGNAIVVWSGTPVTKSQYRTFFDVSTDDGATWSVRDGLPEKGFELPALVNNIFGATDATHWALTSGTEIRITDDGGRTWQSRPDLPERETNGRPLPPLTFPTPEIGWITTEADKVLRTTDSGNTWTDVTNGATPVATTTTTVPASVAYDPSTKGYAVPIPLAMVSPTEGWLCRAPLLEYTADAGTTWKNVRAPSYPPTRPLSQPPVCAVISGGEAWMVTQAKRGNAVQLIHITGAGHAVDARPLSLPSGYFVDQLSFADSQHGWALAHTIEGSDTIGLLTRDGGRHWTLGGDGLGVPRFSSPTDGWKISDHKGTLAHTTDGGFSWHDVAVPTPTGDPDLGGSQLREVVPLGDTVIAIGSSPTGSLTGLFFDVSTDGGRTWTQQGHEPPSNFGSTEASVFSATDAEHWQLSESNRLWTTSDGGNSWTDIADFAGIFEITDVSFMTPEIGFVSGSGSGNPDSYVVLQTNDGGATWVTITSVAPPLATNATVINFPGGIIGCPTHPLTAPPAGDPPPGLESAAFAYVRAHRHWEPASATEIYRIGTDGTTGMDQLFDFQVTSCGAGAHGTYMVEVHGASGQGGGGGTDRVQLTLAHSADGWHVFGSYH